MCTLDILFVLKEINYFTRHDGLIFYLHHYEQVKDYVLIEDAVHEKVKQSIQSQVDSIVNQIFQKS